MIQHWWTPSIAESMNGFWTKGRWGVSVNASKKYNQISKHAFLTNNKWIKKRLDCGLAKFFRFSEVLSETQYITPAPSKSIHYKPDTLQISGDEQHNALTTPLIYWKILLTRESSMQYLWFSETQSDAQSGTLVYWICSIPSLKYPT